MGAIRSTASADRKVYGARVAHSTDSRQRLAARADLRYSGEIEGRVRKLPSISYQSEWGDANCLTEIQSYWKRGSKHLEFSARGCRTHLAAAQKSAAGERLSRLRVLRRDGWRCQFCGSRQNLEVHHQHFRSHSGEDTERNLITLCNNCHISYHGACRRPVREDLMRG